MATFKTRDNQLIPNCGQLINLGTKQIGLYSEDYIKGQILNPRENQAPGFEDAKSKKAMPTYYGDDLSEDELSALVSFLKTLRDPTHMPVEGKFGNQWTWWDDKDAIAVGKQVFEGLQPETEGLTCAVCHGKDGIPMMTGALDFRLNSTLIHVTYTNSPELSRP